MYIVCTYKGLLYMMISIVLIVYFCYIIIKLHSLLMSLLQELWFDEADISRGLEPMAIPVELPLEGPCPMPPFVYITSDVISEMAVVDNERESSCKCYGQDCTLDPDACDCIQKMGGKCAYTGDGLLEDVDSAVSKVQLPIPLVHSGVSCIGRLHDFWRCWFLLVFKCEGIPPQVL